MCTIEDCDLEIFEDKDKDKCILHCKKDDWFNNINGEIKWNKRKIKSFWKAVQYEFNKIYYYRIRAADDNYMQNYTFEEVNFPEFQNEVEPCFIEDEKGNTDKLCTNYYSLVNNNGDNQKNDIFERLNIEFKNCDFLSVADLKKYNFTGIITFENCRFHKELKLPEKMEGMFNFINECDFKNNILNLNYKIFNSKFYLQNCKNISELQCEKTIFNTASFRETKFNDINFRETSFTENVSFIETKFKGKVDFSHSTFNKICSFRKSVFYKKLDLTDTVFNDNVNFLNIKTNELNRETARIIKDSFEKQNNIIEANRFYKLEMIKREKELEEGRKNCENFFELLVFKIHGLSSNYSQNWILPILWIIIFGLFNSFYQFMIIENNNKDLVYFSNDLFLGILVFSFSCFYIYILLESKKFNIYLSLISFSVVLYIFYVLVTNDFYLTFFAINTNPFSIMKNGEHLTLIGLLFRVIIAYLIYQLIISIRQNTRRK